MHSDFSALNCAALLLPHSFSPSCLSPLNTLLFFLRNIPRSGINRSSRFCAHKSPSKGQNSPYSGRNEISRIDKQSAASNGLEDRKRANKGSAEKVPRFTLESKVNLATCRSVNPRTNRGVVACRAPAPPEEIIKEPRALIDESIGGCLSLNRDSKPTITGGARAGARAATRCAPRKQSLHAGWLAARVQLAARIYYLYACVCI